MSEIGFSWIFGAECTITEGLKQMLIDGEEAVYCCKSIRDIAVFTNKRLIYSDTQGMTGKKKEIYSLPYKSITMYSSENAGTLDFTSEIELWTRAGQFKISLKRGADVRKIDKIIAQYVL